MNERMNERERSPMVAEMHQRPIQSSSLLAPPPPPPPPLHQPSMAIQMAPALLGSLLVMLLLLLLLFLLACRPWRFIRLARLRRLLFSPTIPSSALKSGDLERPLFLENEDYESGQNYDLSRNITDVSGIRIDERSNAPSTHVLGTKKRVQSADFHINEASSLSLDVISDIPEALQVGQTLKRPIVSNWPVKDAKHFKDASHDLEFSAKDVGSLRSCLTLEVIAGPARGSCCSRQSKDTDKLPLTLGRVSPCDLLLKDSEVSGKHALIDWNMNSSKWELVDMGSLNGTLLNSQAVHHPQSESRHWSNPVELANGDIVTLGTSSRLHVQVTQHIDKQIPFGIGMASDPMAMRRGGKMLPMEDICYCQWPLPGVDQFGLFCIFDGHGGAGAAKAASKLLPKNVANILSDPDERGRVFSQCDASGVLRDAFSLTEAALDHQYEGCTATVLLVWLDHNEEIFAQCANVGDSACIMSINEKLINMTEDHRLSSLTEHSRMAKMGMPLKDGETRLCGINLARMLGDKFLKEQDVRFSSEPYVSPVVHISKACTAFAVIASDGLWDVISTKKAVQLVLQMKARENAHDRDSAGRIANFVLNEARALRTKDNTSVIFLDFDSMRIDSCITNS
ncbi:Kinase associated protein phosphatase protein [Dioscorea alata]|uniref:Kinase associated protein phosphatase protein n=1 Tax=Dioscorea alata TaxID=55571 RepID=A0ACB7VX60_DIOAL|nr:Kinase associated protein phosphatase protein [Dioscorea alata]